MTITESGEQDLSCRVVVIEDNKGDVYLISEALRSAGLKCQIDTIEDGEAAISFVQDASMDGAPRPDVVLLDLNLPRFDGVEILRVMRDSGFLAHTPVIVLSSSVSKGGKDVAASYDVALQLVKPTDLDEFMLIGKAVRAILEDRREQGK